MLSSNKSNKRQNKITSRFQKFFFILPTVYQFYLLTLLLNAMIAPNGHAGTDSLIFDHFADQTLYFRENPTTSPAALKPLKTNLFDLVYLGLLRPQDGEPYFLFTGKTCPNCPEDRSIYAIRPSTGKPIQFVYPGKLFDPKSRGLVLQSEAYFGKCLPNHGDVLVFFQKEKVDRRPRLQPSVLIAEAEKNYLHETLIERHLPSSRFTQQAEKKKICQKIEGRNRVMPTQGFELGARAGFSLDEEEDDDPNVENEVDTPVQ